MTQLTDLEGDQSGVQVLLFHQGPVLQQAGQLEGHGLLAVRHGNGGVQAAGVDYQQVVGACGAPQVPAQSCTAAGLYSLASIPP